MNLEIPLLNSLDEGLEGNQQYSRFVQTRTKGVELESKAKLIFQ